MYARWLGNAAVEIRGDRNILIDPAYTVEPEVEPDIVLVSHEHDDHFREEIGEEFPGADLYAPLSVFEDFNVEGEIVKGGRQLEGEIDTFTIECYNARAAVAYYYSGVYQTGDASRYPDPGKEVSVLFTACFPDLFAEYIAACREIQPKLVVPYHYDVHDSEASEAADELVEKLTEEGLLAKTVEPGASIMI